MIETNLKEYLDEANRKLAEELMDILDERIHKANSDNEESEE